MPDFGRVSLIDASPHNPGGRVCGGEELSDRRSQALHLQDARLTERRGPRSSTAFPTTISCTPCARIRSRPACCSPAPSTASTFRSTTAASGNPSGMNLPEYAGVAISLIEGNDLVIATHGRSFYVLDDITPLRQLTPTMSARNRAPVLCRPRRSATVSPARIDYYLAEAVRQNPDRYYGLEGTGDPHLHRHAQRPAGWSWKGRPRRECRRRGDPLKREAAGGFGGGGRGRGANPTPPDKAGLNRFTWDMRYPGAKTFEGMMLWSGNTQGPVAVPGTYPVRLTANGKTMTRAVANCRRTRASTASPSPI